MLIVICARLNSKHVTHMNPYLMVSRRQVLVLCLIYWWGNWGTKKLRNESKDKQPVSCRASIETQSLAPESVRLATCCGPLDMSSALFPQHCFQSLQVPQVWSCQHWGQVLLEVCCCPCFTNGNFEIKAGTYILRPHTSYWQNPGVLLSCWGLLLLSGSLTDN